MAEREEVGEEEEEVKVNETEVLQLEPPTTKETFNSDIEKRIVEAFEVFDHAGNKTVDVREVGTILRSLGCVPTEAEIQEIIVNVEDQESSGSVQLDRFLPYVSQIINEYKLQPASAEDLLKAFQTLDEEGVGYITREYMTNALLEGHEPFTQEEIDEMMDVAVDPRTNNINYELYINQIMVPKDKNIFSLLSHSCDNDEVKKVSLREFMEHQNNLYSKKKRYGPPKVRDTKPWYIYDESKSKERKSKSVVVAEEGEEETEDEAEEATKRKGSKGKKEGGKNKKHVEIVVEEEEEYAEEEQSEDEVEVLREKAFQRIMSECSPSFITQLRKPRRPRRRSSESGDSDVEPQENLDNFWRFFW